MKKGAKFGLLGLLAGAAGMGSLAAAGNYFYELAMVPKRHDSAGDTDPSDEIYQGRLWLAGLKNRRDVSVTSVDGLRLHASLIRCADPNCHRWAVCIHGYADSSESMGVYARHYLEQGWNVLLPDLRGHGASQGDYVGYGWDDRLDLVAWVSRLIHQDPKAPLVLHGVSMGAAAALMTTGGPLPANVKAVVSDCAYTSALAIMRHVLEQNGNGKGPAGPALSALRSTAKRRAKFDLKNADTLNAVRRSKTPTLFIHGVNDDFVPASMMADLYEAAKCPKEFLWMPRAGHARSVVTDPALYWETVDDFLQRALEGGLA